MRIFISWSGDLARQVAEALRDWLPVLFDGIDPWMSAADIDAGQRGLNEIEESLATAKFGIIVLTRQNQGTPWINFEAGALSRALDDAEHRVAPLIVDGRISDVTGPIAQFQVNLMNERGIFNIVRSIAAVHGETAAAAVQARFDLSWQTLWEQLQEIEQEPATEEAPAQPDRPSSDILEEILVGVRALLRDDDAATPPSGAAALPLNVAYWAGPGAPDLPIPTDIAEGFVRAAAEGVGVPVLSIAVLRRGATMIGVKLVVPHDTSPARAEQLRFTVSNVLNLELQNVITEGEEPPASG